MCMSSSTRTAKTINEAQNVDSYQNPRKGPKETKWGAAASQLRNTSYRMITEVKQH